MKKLVAWFLLFVFLVNIIGFRISYLILENKADLSFNKRIDNQSFNYKDLIQIDLPNPIPYIKSQKEFKRVNGETSYKNKIYKYVYLRVRADKISILCLPDAKKGEIKSLHKSYEAASNDSDSKAGKIANKIILSDFLPIYCDYSLLLFPSRVSNTYFVKPNFYRLIHVKVVQLPPEVTVYC